MLKNKCDLLKQEGILLPFLADTYTQIHIYLLVNTYVKPSASDESNTVLNNVLCRRT